MSDGTTATTYRYDAGGNRVSRAEGLRYDQTFFYGDTQRAAIQQGIVPPDQGLNQL